MILKKLNREKKYKILPRFVLQLYIVAWNIICHPQSYWINDDT